MLQKNIFNLKREKIEYVAGVREHLKKQPDLTWLFFELTTKCNLHCQHCGSECVGEGDVLEVPSVVKALKSVPTSVMIALTGGEPMLHPKFYQIARSITELGFSWGMTSNATLIDDAAALKLKETGMKTISVSIDGLEKTHDTLRGKNGAWQLAFNGIRALQRAGFEPDVTTVVHPGNLDELEALEEVLKKENVISWRIINVEPIGRARHNKKLQLDPQQFQKMIDFIRDRHLNSEMDVSFGCSHYLGLETERMIRDQFFFCGAGITIASIRANGDITACLDIEKRPEFVQGNIYEDDFKDVWHNRFQPFRTDRTAGSEKCSACTERFVCGGDSAHTWDYDNHLPLLCGKEYMEAK